MFFYIKHHHRLKFDSPVFCEPSILRLHPQSRLGVRIHEVRLHLQPEIGELFLQQDVDGNACWKIVFSEIRLTQAGLSDEVIISAIQTRGTRVDLSPKGLIELKKNGVSDHVLVAAQNQSPAERIVTPAPNTIIAEPVPSAVIITPGRYHRHGYYRHGYYRHGYYHDVHRHRHHARTHFHIGF